MYDPKAWHRAKAFYEHHKADYIAGQAGMYVLIHVKTFAHAFGDPKSDVKNGGQVDAFVQHRKLHGELWGEFFGTRIPAQ